jgi:hypothetical protein
MSHTAHVMRAQEQARQRNARGSETTGGFRGELTGKIYDSREARDFYESREVMRRNVPTEAQLAWEALPLDKAREVIDGLIGEEQERDAKVVLRDYVIPTFLRLHPEFDNSMTPGNENGNKIRHELSKHGIKCPTLPQLEEAYNSLRASGLIRFNQAEIQKQRESEIDRHAREIEDSRIMPSDEELETMPLDEIRRRATPGGWLR